MRNLVLASLVTLLLVTTPAAAGETMGFGQVKSALAAKSIRLIDVREADEFAEAHVPGAQNQPLSTFSPAALPKASEGQVVLMCRSGRRAAEALERVKAAGRTDVIVYPGSMNEWTREGGPVATGP